jgi:3-mercaptopyruvate sulfurtransferase SseA
MHIPAEDLRARHRALNGYDLVIVYGDTYNDPLAIAVSKGLIELGHDARTLRGGLRAWQASGNTVATGDDAPPEPPAAADPGAEGG